MEVEQQHEWISVPGVLLALLNELSAITDYRTLRDSLPRCLTALLKCHSVLLYQRVGDDLHFVSGSFNEKPGWSSSLLAVAHINPVNLDSDVAEACAWRERHAIIIPASCPSRVVLPLVHRHRGIGVLVVIRDHDEEVQERANYWADEEVSVLEAVAGVVALLLENTRLLERERERIHELSLLNNISSQMNCSMYELKRIRRVVIQRTKEISTADLCDLIEPSAVTDAVEWMSPMLREKLLQHFLQQRALVPLVIERPGEQSSKVVNDYLDLLPTNIKTFFAVPLLSGHAIGKRDSSLLRGSLGTALELRQVPQVLGVVVGGYHRPWKLRREELVLLQILASQTSAVLENMHLMAEVVEARNEAR